METLVFFLSNVTCMYEVKFQKGGSKGPEIEILTVIIKLACISKKSYLSQMKALKERLLVLKVDPH